MPKKMLEEVELGAVVENLGALVERVEILERRFSGTLQISAEELASAFVWLDERRGGQSSYLAMAHGYLAHLEERVLEKERVHDRVKIRS